MEADRSKTGSSSQESPGSGADTPEAGRVVDPPKERTAGEIQHWFVTYLAKLLGTAPEAIDVTVPFENFALDSVSAVGMTGDLEDWLGHMIDPTMVFDYPTIELVSRYLAEEIRAQ